MITERIKDKWLTWRTGKPKQRRDYEAWLYSTVNYSAHYVSDQYKNFKYVFQVDYYKFFDDKGMTISVQDDLRQYMYPQRELGDNITWDILRGYEFHGDFSISDFGDTEDRVYVATNNHEDAIMIALKYS